MALMIVPCQFLFGFVFQKPISEFAVRILCLSLKSHGFDMCRFHFFRSGRIQAIQLEYSESYQRLMMAVRKAPQGYAAGFSVMAHKLVVIVQLLMGEWMCDVFWCGVLRLVE